MENEIKNANQNVDIETKERQKKDKRKRKHRNWKSFGLGTLVGAGLLLAGATIMTMVSGEGN